MNFTVKEINRAYRDVNNVMSDILGTNDRNLYKTYVSRFIKEIQENPVLKYILDPYFDIETDVLKEQCFGERIELNIPSDINIQIAFVLKVLKDFTETSSDNICYFLYKIFRAKGLEENICFWNNNVVRPVFRDITIKIKDLIDDIPSEVTEVEGKYMTIINYGNYNSSNSQVANGNQNIQTQNTNTEDFFENIIDIINKDVNENEKKGLIELVNELKETNSDEKGFKEKVTEFIKKTAGYATSFMGIWEQLNNMFK